MEEYRWKRRQPQVPHPDIFLARIQHDLLRASSTTKSFSQPLLFMKGKTVGQITIHFGAYNAHLN